MSALDADIAAARGIPAERMPPELFVVRPGRFDWFKLGVWILAAGVCGGGWALAFWLALTLGVG